ncbi:hypothetical protein F4780DRAFT_64914 [Xylariomycetidae sp. FL0641]|nr:hypothetical protein F4780DRAFT_64914 [Xylariomycetidae sp. FL0641]
MENQFLQFKALPKVRGIVSFGGWTFSTNTDTFPIFQTNTATTVTAAGKASKIVVGMMLYGRSYQMSEPSCFWENCHFNGPAGSPPGASFSIGTSVTWVVFGFASAGSTITEVVVLVQHSRSRRPTTNDFRVWRAGCNHRPQPKLKWCPRVASRLLQYTYSPGVYPPCSSSSSTSGNSGPLATQSYVEPFPRGVERWPDSFSIDVDGMCTSLPGQGELVEVITDIDINIQSIHCVGFDFAREGGLLLYPLNPPDPLPCDVRLTPEGRVPAIITPDLRCVSSSEELQCIPPN